jgi:exopolyphosphatase/guanosine-5'-triphosphate,3'-diphosphate pyrophosphatase
MANVPDLLAAIDLGTNSIHLVVARVGGSNFEVVEREREMVRLGSPTAEGPGARRNGDDEMRLLDPAAMDRAIATLGRFRQVAAISTDHIRVVATSAVREAENRADFLQRVRDEVGLEVEVISGFEEARLIHLGVLQAVPVFDKRLLVCDIGGGSTELVVGQRGDVLASRSFKLGAIRLTQRFFPGGAADKAAVNACRDFVRGTIASFVRDVRRMDVEVAVGSSGTIGAVCEMVAARRDQPRPRTYNNFTIDRHEVRHTVKHLLAAPTTEDRANIAGLDPKRADIIVAGALILEQVMVALDIDELTFSDYALREGVLLDSWRRTHGGSLHHLSDLRRRSVLHLSELMDEDPAHSAQVARLALELFDGTVALHGLGDDSREILEAAALLCNVGLFVSHAGHHKHTYYVIRNSEHLSGFTDREIELIAQVARYHRKSPPSTRHVPYAALSGDDRRRVAVLAGLLRVAVGLDRSHAARVGVARVRVEPDEVVVEAVPDGQGAPDGLELEIYSARQRSGLLSSALGLPVDVVAAAAA